MNPQKKVASTFVVVACLAFAGCRSTPPQFSVFNCRVVSEKSLVQFEVDAAPLSHNSAVRSVGEIASYPEFMEAQSIVTDIHGRFLFRGQESLVYEVVIRSVEPREERIGERFKDVRFKSGITNTFRIVRPVFD